MKLFLTNLFKFSLFGLIIIFIVIMLYIIYDPFKVLKSYSNYSNSYVITNRDYISTEMYVKNKNKIHYNSFIFGSSRTIAFKPTSWLKYLPKYSQPFMFDASGESIYGIYLKFKYLESLNIKIDNALIILCRDASFNYDNNIEGHLFIKHPLLSGESKFNFQLEFFKAFINPKFLFCFFSYTFRPEYYPYMQGYIEDRKIIIDSISNEIIIVDQENEIKNSTSTYYSKRATQFYLRTGERFDSIPRINEKQLFMLNEIKRILELNKTNYKVVISPLYEQMKFNKEDLSKLNKTFQNRLYDFSGKNTYTDDIMNYYEISHYRPNVGDSILKTIYN